MMRNKRHSTQKTTVHVYGSRYAEDKKLANAAYRLLGTGQDINFPREGQYAHSHGIPITGDWEEIERYVWQFVCIADILGEGHRNKYQFIVHHFDGFEVGQIAPLFYQAFKIANITLPAEYHAYIESISTAKGLPSLYDINVYDSLDERAAVREFLGKTQDDIYRELEENLDCDCSFMESFYYLGPKAFAYYITVWEQLFAHYQATPDNDTECDLAESALFLLSQRNIMNPEDETPEGFAARLRLLEQCEQHYKTAADYYDQRTLNKALKKCSSIREELLKHTR